MTKRENKQLGVQMLLWHTIKLTIRCRCLSYNRKFNFCPLTHYLFFAGDDGFQLNSTQLNFQLVIYNKAIFNQNRKFEDVF